MDGAGELVAVVGELVEAAPTAAGGGWVVDILLLDGQVPIHSPTDFRRNKEKSQCHEAKRRALSIEWFGMSEFVIYQLIVQDIYTIERDYKSGQ